MGPIGKHTSPRDLPTNAAFVSARQVRNRLTTLPQPHEFLAPEADEAHHARKAYRSFTCADPQETNREEEVAMCHEGQKGQHHEPFQGQ